MNPNPGSCFSTETTRHCVGPSRTPRTLKKRRLRGFVLCPAMPLPALQNLRAGASMTADVSRVEGDGTLNVGA